MINKKPSEQSFKNIEDKLNEGYNLVDYFLTIGSNPSIYQNTWLYESDISTLNTKYKEQLKPIIINKFPLKDKKLVGFNEAIIQHCFPNGFEVKEFYKQPEYKIFSILLDNNNYAINYPFKYVVCLRFYESINNYKKLFDKYNEYKNINMPEDSDDNDNGDNFMKSKSFNMSLKGLEKNIQFHDNEDIHYPEPLDGSFYESNFSISDSRLNLVKTNNLGRKTEDYKFGKRIEKNVMNKYKKYYIPKCLCLISLYPFINELSKIIKNIYQYSLGEKQIHPLEKIINNLLIEVPTPPKGIYYIEYSLINENIILKATQRNELHVLNLEFQKLFMLFTPNKILEIFRYLMLEAKIIMFSEEINNLTPVILSLLNLLFPFKYPYIVVSILHKDAYKIIDSISPVFVGINENYNINFLSENDIDINDFTLIVNIDKKELIPLEPDSKKKGKPLPELPSKYKASLENKIINCFIEIKKNKKMIGRTNYLQQNIRRYFLEFQLDLMKDYSKYLNNDIYKHQGDDKTTPLEKAFKLKEFLNKVPSEYYDFYEYFLGTQMFGDFLYKRMMPRDKNEQIDILYFEELLLKNKTNCILLNSQRYKFTTKYQVQKPTPLTQQQIYHFNHFNTRKKLLLNGIEITNAKEMHETNRRKSFTSGANINFNEYMDTNINDIISTDINDDNNNNYNFKKRKITNIDTYSSSNIFNLNQPLFTYIIFPKLDNEYFYKNDINNYHIDFTMFQEVKNIDNELLSRSHLSRVEIKTNETTNYIHLLWLKLWISTFHYQDKQEQFYRFFQMMNIIERINQHEMGIIDNLFWVLFKYQIDDDLILLLYQKILCFHLIPSDFIFRKIGTLIYNKKQMLKLKTFNISKYIKSLKEKLNDYSNEALNSKKTFRKRTLRSIYDTEILVEKISFLFEENSNECDKCNNKININQFMIKINDNDIFNDLLWAKCPYCGANYLPTLKIIFGTENNKNNKLFSNTSIVDNITLYSPKTLNYDMLGNIQNNYEINVEELKIHNNPFFWNVFWYFKINKLPYDFILPYKQNIIHQLTFRNPKEKTMNENFKFSFCDYVKKAKENLEYKRKHWNGNNKLMISHDKINIFIPPTNNFNKY